MLESAFGVDAIIPINRVKTHTSFKGCVESGLCKKLVVGLGGPGGAGQFHSLGQAELPRLLVEVTKVILGKMPVLGGVAIVENAYEETARIKAIPARRSSRKKSGCWRGRSRSCPPCPRTGCTASSWRKWGRISAEPESTPISSDGAHYGRTGNERPRIRYVSVLDLSEASHGNATGRGPCGLRDPQAGGQDRP